jgi:prepilin-type N-terminal cleavage/methylation domain-containing protein
MTLIELMVSLAIVSVLLTTATALVTTLSQLKRDGERVVEVRGNAATAMNLIQFDALNAGFRFASPAHAVRVIPNVSGAEAELSPVTATTNCGAPNWGVAPLTDVIEFRSGMSNSEPANIVSGSCTGATCTLSFTPSRPGIDPVATEVVLMSDGTTRNVCMGRVTSVSGTNLTVQLLSQDFSNATTSSYVGCMGTVGPANQGVLMKLERRARYMICAPPAASPDLRPGLYVQVSGSDGSFAAAPVTLLQEGVEDLQAAWFVTDTNSEITGGSCVGSGSGRVCECDSVAGSPCTAATVFKPAPTITGSLDATTTATFDKRGAYQIRGIAIGLTTISMRARTPRNSNTTLEQFVRPALFDHPLDAVPVKSGNFRSTLWSSVVMQNIVMVQP